jgi:hypothetical protein
METLSQKIKNEKHFILLLAVAALALLQPAIGVGDIFTWQDAEGVIHFSNRDVPAGAHLYMEEPPDRPHPREAGAPIEAVDAGAEENPALQEQLDAVGRDLSTALTKVDDLTRKIEAAQMQTEQAAQAAQRAADEAARLSDDSDIAAQERVVVYGVPYLPVPSARNPHPDNRPPHRKQIDGTGNPLSDPGGVRDPGHPLSRGPSGFEKTFIRRENSLSNVQQLINRTESPSVLQPHSDGRDASQEQDPMRRKQLR